uniref:Microtubule associated tumor suppressor 1a n=1 Tax=Cyprinus carpio TaxID=7962 RepID=A0A8C1TV78_CYPCA
METTRRSVNLTFSIEDKNGNNITCPSEHSPDSLRGSSSLSCGSSDSPPGEEMEDCITFPTKGETSSKLKLKSSGEIAVDFVQSNTDNWNENMTLLIVDPKNTECNGCDRSSETSPDCGERELSEVDSCEPSRHGSSENCCSVSSGEMVMRSNSFLLHQNDQLLSISLTGESRTSLDISSDLAVVSGTLPDVCKGLTKVPQEEPKTQGLECTYIQPNNQTFLIDEKSLSTEKLECGTPVHYHKSNKDVAILACSNGGSNHSTPLEGKTVLLTASDDLDISGNAETSTPVQSVSNKTLCLPSLSESPLNKDEGDSVSPMAQVISQKQGAASQKPKTPLASAKSNKTEIKRFPKPNFSNIKSKIMSRATNPFKTSSAQVPKTLSNAVPQNNESQTMDQHKSSPTKSPFTAVTSTSATPAQSVKSSNATKRTRSSTCQESGLASKSRPRRWSESATSFKTSKGGSQDKNPQLNGVLNSLVTPQKNTKGGAQNQGGKPAETESNREDTQGNESLKVRGKNQKVSLSAVSARPSAAAACEWSRSRLGSQPSPARTGGASAAHVPAANLRPPPSASKLKPGSAGKDGSSTTDMPSPRSKLSTSDAPASASKLPVKPKLQTKSSSTSQTNGHTKRDHAEPSMGTLSKPPSNRTTLLRTKLQCPPIRSVSSGCKNTSSSGSSRSSCSPLKTPTTAKLMRPAATPTVDKSRTSSRNQQPPTNGQPDLVPPESKSRNVEYYKALCEKKNQTIQQLENTLRSNNCRFEAVAVVIKHLCAGHEEMMKQRRELSQELVTLREELVSSAHSCERLEQDKEELRAAFDGVLQKVQEQHHSDLADLEERLKTFYSTEWEKVHQTYQEEADKCKAQMEQQLKELRAKHEALKKELETSHMEEVDDLKQQFEETFKELKQSHEKEMQSLNATLKESEDTLSNRIQELITENNNLKEKLNAEVKRRMDLAEKTQDSHTLYLEQELESLKVVLDIKNKQIHEQDKKLLQIDKLMERNVKLDECLKKLQQENEDLKARMDRHAALSRYDHKTNVMTEHVPVASRAPLCLKPSTAALHSSYLQRS